MPRHSAPCSWYMLICNFPFAEFESNHTSTESVDRTILPPQMFLLDRDTSLSRNSGNPKRQDATPPCSKGTLGIQRSPKVQNHHNTTFGPSWYPLLGTPALVRNAIHIPKNDLNVSQRILQRTQGEVGIEADCVLVEIALGPRVVHVRARDCIKLVGCEEVAE